jgi:hypothetical protein
MAPEAGNTRALTLPLVGVRRTGETRGSPRQVDEFVLRSKANEAGWGYNGPQSIKIAPTPTLRVDPPHRGEGEAS